MPGATLWSLGFFWFKSSIFDKGPNSYRTKSDVRNHIAELSQTRFPHATVTCAVNWRGRSPRPVWFRPIGQSWLHDEFCGAGRTRRSGAIRDQVADQKRGLGPTVALTAPARACLSCWAGRHIRSPCWRSCAQLSLCSEAKPSARRAATLRCRLVVSDHHSLLHGFCGQSIARPTRS